MKRIFVIIALLCISGSVVVAQKKIWNVDVHSFFDNTEFGGSKAQMPQTMAGTHFAPTIGLSWDSVHRVYVGCDVMHEWGSNKTIDFVDPTAYYEYDYKPLRFLVGAFPRKLAFNDYPLIFFCDSIRNYRPNANGIFWEAYGKKSYFNVWLDWMSRQTFVRHETFLLGESGKLFLGPVFLQHFGYMYHFAGLMDPNDHDPIHDNMMYQCGGGIDLAEKTGLDKLETSVNWVVGLEDERGVSQWMKHHGLLIESTVEYRGIGFKNTFYKGDGQMHFFHDHGMLLYWGDRIYRDTQYDRVDGYIQFFKTDVVNIRLTYSLHFAESQMFHEQMLSARFDIGNVPKRAGKPYRYFWTPILQAARGTKPVAQ